MVIKTATVRAHVRMCNVPGKPGVGRRQAASGSKQQAAGAGGKSRGDWKGRAREGGGATRTRGAGGIGGAVLRAGKGESRALDCVCSIANVWGETV